MAGQPVVQCLGPSYHLVDRKSAVQRSVNLFLREIEGLGENRQVVLESAPGWVQYADLGQTVRGSYVTGDRWFIVSGQSLLEMTSGTPTALGSVLGYDLAAMKHGETQLVVVDGTNGYVYSLTSGSFALISAPGWRGSAWIEHLDGYFIATAPDSDQFYVSAIDDGTKWDAVDFSSADAQPGKIVTHRVLHRELLLFCQYHIEVWIDSGEPDFPFTRYNSTPIDIGLVGKRAVVSAADTIFFVGQTKTGRGTVYVMSGHQPVRISTRAVEEALQASTDLSACSMWTYQARGSEFIGINAPGLEATWCYDAASKQWHELGEWIDGAWVPWRIDHVVCFQGKHYGAGGTKVYRIDPEVHDLAGAVLMRERTWPHLVAGTAEAITFRSLEIACTTGYGGELTLEISNDGGFNWGSPLLRSLGAVGRWMERIRWQFLGAARDRVYRIRCGSAVPFRIHGATMETSQ